MKITFLGGTETVTGSKFLITTETTQVLVDCGLFQGFKWLRERNWQPLLLDLEKLDAVLLTHGHLDHSGYLPVLYKQGYRGPIYSHHATKSLCDILLADSGHIQEADAKYLQKHKKSKHKKPAPLYDEATAQACMSLFKGIDFYKSVEIGNIRFYFQPVGHILGAASIIIQAEGKTIGFSGDVGRPDDIFMYPPDPLPKLDYLLLESTYGDRRHSLSDPLQELAQFITETAKQGGTILVPSFSIGRAQTLQHMLVKLMDEKRIPNMPVYLDSPMAIRVTEVYCDFDEHHKLSNNECQKMCQRTQFTPTVEDSKALEDIIYPHIIIAGSGMATGGRILHHFKKLIGDPKTRVLFTGYQAGGTRGAKLLAGEKKIRIHGEWFPVKATIHNLDGLSGHADYVDMLNWLKESKLEPSTKIKLIHGEPDALEAMRVHLAINTDFEVDVASYHQILTI